jgi:hypothetical protein
MLFLFLLAVGLLAAVGYASWPAISAARKTEAAERDRTDAATPETGPTTLEGALAAQLIGGRISPRQYQLALARLAVRDDAAHPLSVPETGESGTVA